MRFRSGKSTEMMGLREVTEGGIPSSFQETGEAALIRGVSEGCEASFNELFRRWTPRLMRFLTGATGSRETGEDLLQETFLRILNGAPAYEPRGDAGAWIYRIAANVAYSYWRRERARPLHTAQPIERVSMTVASPNAGPEAVRDRGAFLRDVNQALGLMDGNKRMVFLLKAGEGLTYDEIARVMGCPSGTVKSRFHHAVRILQDELSGKDWNGHQIAEEVSPDVD
jgi:RNA polymerase sigma-70 factor, ECF subfamily